MFWLGYYANTTFQVGGTAVCRCGEKGAGRCLKGVDEGEVMGGLGSDDDLGSRGSSSEYDEDFAEIGGEEEEKLKV